MNRSQICCCQNILGHNLIVDFTPLKMPKLILVTTLFFFLFSLSSCISSNVQKIGNIDFREKSIAVQQGGGELSTTIKSALRADGWQIIAVSGTKVTPGDGLQFQGVRGRQARYSMLIESYQYDIDLLTLKPLYRCNISILDTKTGDEIMTLNGEGTSQSITEKIIANLR